MKITVDEHGYFQIEEAFSPVTFVSSNNERLGIVMRDSGFEAWYKIDDNTSPEIHVFTFASRKNAID